MKNIIFLFCLPLLVLPQSSDNSKYEKELFAVFYNVENLFDTINNPDTKDDEFLPNSEKEWNSYRYNYKLNQLERVFKNLIEDKYESRLPDIIGLCEVENKLVIDDLLKKPIFNEHKYKIVHKQSPDGRGIDCAILVSDKLELLKSDFIEIKNPKESRPTRDIVVSKLRFNNQVVNVYVNHWPSRWGGQEASNHKRVFVSNVLRDYINLNTNNNDLNIIMGDFNDYPSNESLAEVLVQDDLTNLMSSSNVNGRGSYNYRGNWNWLDQIIISKIHITSDLKLISCGSFEKDFMIYTNKKGEEYPSRSFGGNNWYGGFSDHLPVFLHLGWN